MTWYAFQDYNERYVFIKYYNSVELNSHRCFVLVAPESRPTERLLFYFVSYPCSWRLLSGPTLSLYRKKLNASEIITSNQQFTLYSNTDYIEIFCRYSGDRPYRLQHLSFDLGTVIFEAIFLSNIYVIRCLGEGIL